MAQTYSNIEPRGNVDRSAATLQGERMRRAAIAVAGTHDRRGRIDRQRRGTSTNRKRRRTDRHGRLCLLGFGVQRRQSTHRDCEAAGARAHRNPAGTDECYHAGYGQADCRGRTVQSNHVIYISDRRFTARIASQSTALAAMAGSIVTIPLSSRCAEAGTESLTRA